MKPVRVAISIEVPDGATHYSGILFAAPSWFKCTQVAGFDHWWIYSYARNEWFLASHHKPNFIRELSKDIV